MFRLGKIGSYVVVVAGATLLTPVHNFGARANETQNAASVKANEIPEDLNSEEIEKLVLKEDFSITDEVIKTARNNLNTRFATVALNPKYVLGRNIQKDIDIALENPSTVFTKSLFANQSLFLGKDYMQLIINEKYIDTPLAQIIAERPDFPISKDHMDIKTKRPETLFAQGLENNLNDRVNKGKPTYVTDASFEAKVLKAKVPVLLDFWAPWCPACLRLNPLLEKIAEKYGDRVVIRKLNIDDNPGVIGVEDYKKVINGGIPALMLIKDGWIHEYNIAKVVWAKIDEFEKVQKRDMTRDEVKNLFEETITETLDKYINGENN